MVDLVRLLASVGSIAIVGLSDDPRRPSNQVAAFLVASGYACIGVNPGIAGRRVHGMEVVARLADLPGPVDMIDIFRAPSHVSGIVDEALALPKLPRVVWMQLGIIDRDAEARARAAGLVVVMDACPRIVLGRR